MAKEFSKSFYERKSWQECRLAFMQSEFFICERCGGSASIAHHKEYLTPDNINDPSITLSWANLEAVCQDCHNKEHHGDDERVTRQGTYFDEKGGLVQAPLYKGDK